MRRQNNFKMKYEFTWKNMDFIDASKPDDFYDGNLSWINFQGVWGNIQKIVSVQNYKTNWYMDKNLNTPREVTNIFLMLFVLAL